MIYMISSLSTTYADLDNININSNFKIRHNTTSVNLPHHNAQQDRLTFVILTQ